MTALLLVLVVGASPPFTTPSLTVERGVGVDEALLGRARAACASVVDALGELPRPSTVRVERAVSFEAFTARTGRPAFEAAAFTGDAIVVGPGLERIPAADQVLVHECVHAWLARRASRPRSRALEEVIALRVSGQAARLEPVAAVPPEGLAAIEQVLEKPSDSATYRAALAAAYATLAPTLPADPRALGVFLDDAAPSSALRDARHRGAPTSSTPAGNDWPSAAAPANISP